MRCFFLFCLSIVTIFSSAFGTQSNETDLPSGYVLASLSDLDLEDCPFFDEPVQKGDDSEISEEAASRVMATLEGLPSAVVAGCVNVITGDFFDSQVDLVVPGPQPLVVQRSWCSSEKKWHFGHMPALKVGRSASGDHLLAGYSDDSGMGLFYRASHLDGYRESCSLTIPSKVFE